MPVSEFENDDKGYLKWISDNPDGYVVNTGYNFPEYMVLHQASCTLISRLQQNMRSFTYHNTRKICSLSTSDLTTWIKKQGGNGFSKLCSRCNPNSEEVMIDDVKRYYFDLDNEVLHSRKDSKKRQVRLNTAPKIPESFFTKTRIFRRNPDVIAEVLERANGVCEKCKKKAPFNRASDGTPYLEVHHLIFLSNGGEDTIENTLALCPNCHREFHFGGA
jgi:5-methylcytosine-specific restriction endonuclease McrA